MVADLVFLYAILSGRTSTSIFILGVYIWVSILGYYLVAAK